MISCCSRNLRRVYFLLLVTLLSYWLLSAVQNAGSGGIEILLIFVVRTQLLITSLSCVLSRESTSVNLLAGPVLFTSNSKQMVCYTLRFGNSCHHIDTQVIMASIVEDKMERAIYLTPFSSRTLDDVVGDHHSQTNYEHVYWGHTFRPSVPYIFGLVVTPANATIAVRVHIVKPWKYCKCCLQSQKIDLSHLHFPRFHSFRYTRGNWKGRAAGCHCKGHEQVAGLFYRACQAACLARWLFTQAASCNTSGAQSAKLRSCH